MLKSYLPELTNVHLPDREQVIINKYSQQLSRGAETIQDYLKRAGFEGYAPLVAIIAGSGLGAIADLLKQPGEPNQKTKLMLPYCEIPFFPCPTVDGHMGNLVFGNIAGMNTVVLQGRVHGYEKWHPWDLVRHVRVMALLGVKVVIITCAVGSLRKDLQPGDIAIVQDHIFKARELNPLSGPNINNLGPRFPGMDNAWDNNLRALAMDIALEHGLIQKPSLTCRLDNWLHGRLTGQVVHYITPGPQFETPAEIRAMRTEGADTVGMSAIEVLAAVHAGMRPLGILAIVNSAAGLKKNHQLSHEETLDGARLAGPKITRLIELVVPNIAPLP